VQLEGKVQSRMDVALRDWVGRVTPAAKLLGRNHTEPYTWRPFSNVSEVGSSLCYPLCAVSACSTGVGNSSAVVAQSCGHHILVICRALVDRLLTREVSCWSCTSSVTAGVNTCC
jgi:hypothetical protein